MLLALVSCPVLAADDNTSSPVRTVENLLAKTDCHVAYLVSCHDTSKATMSLVANYPVADFKLPTWLGSRKVTVSADAIGFLDDGIDGGIGGSLTVEKVISKLNVGLGWAPRGYEWSWYVGIAQVF